MDAADNVFGFRTFQTDKVKESGMPNNFGERERDLRNQFEFVVFDGKYNVFNGALVVVDLFTTGGTYTLEYIKSTLGQFGVEVATKMIDEGVDPTREPIYGGVMTFQAWENPFPGITRRISFNNFVPYIAARRVIPAPNTVPKDQYLVGRWTGDSKDTLAVRRGNVILIQLRLEDTVAQLEIGYGDGSSEDQYLVGDWTGDGKDKLAVRRGNRVYYQKDISGGGGVEVSFGNGNTEDQYLVGDWNGDGKDTLAVRRGNRVFCQGTINATVASEVSFGNGNSEDQYLAGDWNGDGTDRLAVRRGKTIIYQNGSGAGVEVSFGNGNSEDQYLVGDWTGDGKDKLAVRRGNKVFYQRNIGDTVGVEISYGNG